MNFCANCGHELGVGRFCTNCGLPVPGRHPGAGTPEPQDDQPTVIAPSSRTTPSSGPPAPAPPAAPVEAAETAHPPSAPTAGSPPPPPRYPLFAEPPAEPPAPPTPAAYAAGNQPTHRRLLPILALLLVLAVIAAGVAAYLLISSGDDDKTATDPATAGPRSHGPHGSPSATHASALPRHSENLRHDVASVDVPATSAFSYPVDKHGNPITSRRVTFGSDHLYDGDPTTAWRMDDPASRGGSLTIHFSRPVTLTSVGMINGYAKIYAGYNGYTANHKVLEARWVFDDGTEVDQHLRHTVHPQTVRVHAGPTSTLRLELVKVSDHDPKTFTAISELALKGLSR